MATNNTPAFVAYHVPDREKAFWTKIGVAWAHKDNDGFNLDLEMIPVGTGRIVLRKYEVKKGEGA